MVKTLDAPEFKDEEEEAQWWVENQALMLKQFEEAAQDGTLGRGTLATRGKTATTTIRLNPEDIELAKGQAAELGLKYQTYLKMILHQALVREATKQKRS